jgi:hypothetical protein
VNTYSEEAIDEDRIAIAIGWTISDEAETELRECGMSLGETSKERSAVLDQDAAPFSSESEAGIDDDGDGGYR